MPLSQQIQDQIRKEAEDYSIELKSTGMGTNLEVAEGREGYKQGATAWAVWKEKAEGMKKALHEIETKVMQYHKLNGDNPAANHCRNIAIEALEQFK